MRRSSHMEERKASDRKMAKNSEQRESEKNPFERLISTTSSNLFAQQRAYS